MVGEIRDKETMEVAINASETDHLVVATVHASSADGVIKKILSMYQGDEKRISAFLAENFI